MKRIDRTGTRQGKLLIVRFAGARPTGNTGRSKAFWLCRCDCGEEVEMSADNLHENRSCGCERDAATAARATTHGRTGSRVYVIWKNMKARCSDPANISYQYYGGKGITVCDRWQDSFENFLADMGEPPSSRHSIDRKDAALCYAPDNCRWATLHEQARNRSTTLFLTIGERTLCVAQWAQETGTSAFTIYTRVRRGWPAQAAIFGR